MFNMRKSSKDLGDATANYEVDCSKGSTVSDFLDWNISRHNTEFGDVHFGRFLNTYADYQYSNFKDTHLIREQYGDRIIKSPIKCNGGWGRMDYWIELVEEIVPLTNMDIFKEFIASTNIDKTLINDWRPCLTEYDVPYIPLAIVIWLNDKSKLIYIHKEEL